jgi:hypothetical protein
MAVLVGFACISKRFRAKLLYRKGNPLEHDGLKFSKEAREVIEKLQSDPERIKTLQRFLPQVHDLFCVVSDKDICGLGLTRMEQEEEDAAGAQERELLKDSEETPG